ncbi:MAG: hypothetical protein ACYS67_20415, partial [Planctomycetota bacterium]
MSIREALRFLGKAFKKNIIPSEKVGGQVPVNELFNVTFEEALQAILGTHKYIIDGDFIRVYTEEEFESIYPEGKTNSQVEVEGAWGEAVEGIEMRVRAERQRWYEGETPKFLVDMRNKGTVEWELGLTQENWEVELDGVWHRVGASFTGDFRTLLFGPGQEYKDIEFNPAVRSEWNIHGK